MRGKLGRWIIRIQTKLFWWLIRALQLESRALGAAYQTMRYEHERLTHLEDTWTREHAVVKRRLEEIEKRLGLRGEDSLG